MAETPDDRVVLSADLDRLRSLSCIKWGRWDSDVLPAWVADMDFAPAPAIVDALREIVDRGDFGYNWAAAKELPEAWVAWQQRRHGWTPDVERVRLFCDVVQGVEVALWLHTKPGDGVVLFTPIYPPFLGAVEKNGRRIMDCPLEPGTWRIDRERLEAAIDERTTAIVLCNPHNPTGAVHSREELLAVLELAEKHDLLVVSDEIWADLVHPGAAHVPFASLSEEASARCVTVTAASKSFSIAGLRTAIAHVGHTGVREAIEALPGHVLGAVGTAGAEATLAAWTRGEPWLQAVRAELTARRDQVARRVAAELPGVGFTSPEATYMAWLDFRALELPDDPAAWLLEHARVGLSAGPDFGPHGTGFARLNFATSEQLLDEILDRIVAAVIGR